MSEEKTASELVLETMRRILEQTTLRAILRPLGRTPLDVTEKEKAELLEPYETQIENDFVMCREVALQLVALAQSSAMAVDTGQDAGEVLILSSEEE